MSTPLLRRFSFLERITHWVVGVTFVLLLLSGLAFAYPSLFWLTTFLGGGAAARVLHPPHSQVQANQMNHIQRKTTQAQQKNTALNASLST